MPGAPPVSGAPAQSKRVNPPSYAGPIHAEPVKQSPEDHAATGGTRPSKRKNRAKRKAGQDRIGHVQARGSLPDGLVIGCTAQESDETGQKHRHEQQSETPPDQPGEMRGPRRPVLFLWVASPWRRTKICQDHRPLNGDEKHRTEDDECP